MVVETALSTKQSKIRSLLNLSRLDRGAIVNRRNYRRPPAGFRVSICFARRFDRQCDHAGNRVSFFRLAYCCFSAKETPRERHKVSIGIRRSELRNYHGRFAIYDANLPLIGKVNCALSRSVWFTVAINATRSPGLSVGTDVVCPVAAPNGRRLCQPSQNYVPD